MQGSGANECTTNANCSALSPTRDERACGTSDCKLEQGVCGDGILQKFLGEQCDPPLHDPANTFLCTEQCRLWSQLCGDGKIDPGEECDDGAKNSDAPDALCRLDCSYARCGDGILDTSLEMCDDGNLRDVDGCSSFCFFEQPATTTLVQLVPTVPTFPSILPPYAFLPPSSAPSFSAKPTLAQLPSLKALPSNQPTGPEIIVIMAAGAAGGLAYMRRRRRKK
ncbi:hypothetical protein A2789_00755 [Candidatus Peribacteria bacterium RIFCSPHIGHO2_01_FULL_54_22]|nr:MAG: hypothetical protein A2789_00755 [Candidatus Peribacteria bacterium RIFCSPHIGHO2_01_FULL_54_22]